MTETQTQTDDSVCLRQFSDGRRCRMLRKPGHSSLCVFHAREEQQLLEQERQRKERDKLAAELATLGSEGRISSDQVATVMTSTFRALAKGRISPRDARTLGYLGQLVPQSLRARSPRR